MRGNMREFLRSAMRAKGQCMKNGAPSLCPGACPSALRARDRSARVGLCMFGSHRRTPCTINPLYARDTREQPRTALAHRRCGGGGGGPGPHRSHHRLGCPRKINDTANVEEEQGGQRSRRMACID
eukprot:gene11649-biopygen9434